MDKIIKEYAFEIAMLQSYLFEIFSHAKKCTNNFENTEWYLNQKVDEKTKNEILNYFQELGINCDCGILSKLELDIDQ